MLGSDLRGSASSARLRSSAGILAAHPPPEARAVSLAGSRAVMRGAPGSSWGAQWNAARRDRIPFSRAAGRPESAVCAASSKSSKIPDEKMEPESPLRRSSLQLISKGLDTPDRSNGRSDPDGEVRDEQTHAGGRDNRNAPCGRPGIRPAVFGRLRPSFRLRSRRQDG